MFVNEPVSVVVDVVGSVTGRRWEGAFKVRPRLSHRDYMRKDIMRRDLLGARPDEADEVASQMAEAFSKIAMHLTDAPSWWKDANNGMDLLDGEPVATLYKLISDKEKEASDSLKTKAEEAKVELKTTVISE